MDWDEPLGNMRAEVSGSGRSCAFSAVFLSLGQVYSGTHPNRKVVSVNQVHFTEHLLLVEELIIDGVEE